MYRQKLRSGNYGKTRPQTKLAANIVAHFWSFVGRVGHSFQGGAA